MISGNLVTTKSRNALVFFSSVAVAVVLFFVFVKIILKPGYAVFDFIQQNNQVSSATEVVIVEVDQPSLDRLAEESVVFPIPRQIYGAVAEVASAANANALAFDILFTEPSSYGVDDDEQFAEMLKKSKLPIFFPAESQFGGAKNPIPSLMAVAKATGAVDLPMDSDGVFRRVPDDLENRVSLASIVAKHVSQNTETHANKILVPYQRDAFTRISLYDVIKLYREKSENSDIDAKLTQLKNKTWLVGYTAPGLFDLRPMSNNKKAPGVLIHATALANRLEKRGLSQISVIVNLIFCFSAVLIALYFINRSQEPIRAGISLAVVSILSSAVLTSVCWLNGIWLDPLTVFIPVAAGGALQLIWNLRRVWAERLKLAETLKSSMSAEMLELIKRGEVEVSRFGEEREITILFSDLAGFTSLSENSTPKQMVQILNEYLDQIVTHLFKHSGYVDKFIGDAVMVLWGAPINQSNHAKLAITAALDFQKVCDEFNQKKSQSDRTFQALTTRVGVHTGLAVVGNIGAKKRFNYTAIGDAVNMASRLEGVGKYYDLKLILSESTVKAANLENLSNIIEIDKIILKGKAEAVTIFTSVDSDQIEAAQDYQRGLQYYYRENWSEAESYFKKAEKIAAAKIMYERCAAAISSGKPENYIQGAWAHDSK